MKLTNNHNLPAPLVSAISNDGYFNPCDIGTTTLISSPRISALRWRNNILEDASDLIYPLLGQALHAVLERAKAPNCIMEWRFSNYIFDWWVSGQIDVYEGDIKTLSDYKLTSIWVSKMKEPAKPEHVAQMNVNKYLIENSIYADFVPIENLQIVNILRDWSKMQVIRDAKYPKKQIYIQHVPVWPKEVVEQYIFMRVLLHQEARLIPSDELIECTPEERWEKPTKYAVMKKGRKSAIRVLDSNEDAERYIEHRGLDDKHYINIREGESTRCEHYCSVNKFCNQYKKVGGE